MVDERLVLSARDVLVRYPKSDGIALRDANLDIARGDTIGLVGESGSGKSTFARVLAGAINPTSGSMTVGGMPWSAIGRRDTRRRRVQMVFQDPYASLNPFIPVLDSVAEVHEVWEGLRRHEARRRAAEGLERMGLDAEFHHENPRRLSGGQCQRVGIARALASQPEVLIADEPTSALDVSTQAAILNLLASLRRERELAIVLISHDLAVVRYLTETTLVFYGGEIVERGPTVGLLEAPRHPYTDLLLASIPGSSRETNPAQGLQPGACAFTTRCPRARERCVAERPELPDVDHAFRCHFPLPDSADLKADESQLWSDGNGAPARRRHEASPST